MYHSHENEKLNQLDVDLSLSENHGINLILKAQIQARLDIQVKENTQLLLNKLHSEYLSNCEMVELVGVGLEL